ncbi:MAG: glycosyltransferase family 2 protein [Steroidobacteraceae bacterium]
MASSSTTRSAGIGPPSRARVQALELQPSIAVLIPCLNEAAAIAKVVRDFRTALPEAKIFVYDNGSADGTPDIAREASAIVRTESMRGKGNVVRRMFADIEADVFVLVDGDDTYDASSAPALVSALLEESLDMVNAARRTEATDAYRPGHRLGNRLLTGLTAAFFGERLSDLLSGYRVFSRRFVKSFPALAAGFEIETELSIHALELRMPIAEVPVAYRERPRGSASKLNTYRDGFRILKTIVNLVKQERPLAFFSFAAACAIVISLALGVPVVLEFMRTHLVPRLPTALLATAMAILAFLSLGCGLILDSVSRGRAELKRLAYLSVPVRFTPVGPAAARWRSHPDADAPAPAPAPARATSAQALRAR